MLNNQIINAFNQELKTNFNSIEQFAHCQFTSARKILIDWRDIDTSAHLKGYDGKAASYKYLTEIVIPKVLQWSTEKKEEIRCKALQICS